MIDYRILNTVIAQIFVRDLISYISYFWRKVWNLVVYENHTKPYTYTSVSYTTVAVRKFLAYESQQTQEYEIFTRTKISAITVLYSIAEIFVRNLISYFRLKVRNLEAHKNHARITVYATPSLLYENL